MKNMNYKRLAVCLAVPQLAGIVGAFFTAPAIPTWYAALQKPSFSPPNWLFGPVWILLYLMMGVAAYLVWSKASGGWGTLTGRNKKAKSALIIFCAHLFFNAIWSVIFFGMRNPGLALVDIVAIWIFIVILIIKFWKIDRRAAWLLIPYFLWVSFASILNYFIWILN